MAERWVQDVEEIIEQLSEVDIGYFSDFIWCGGKEVEAWFYPDGTCLLSKNGVLQNMPTMEVLDFLSATAVVEISG